MRVLITGHAGYIGPVTVETFRHAGHEVVGLDTGYFRDCVAPGAEAPAPDREIRRDIRDVAAGDLSGIDAVVHLAALSNDPLGELDPALTRATNERASLRLAHLARAAGARRFVFASSCSLYGAAGNAAAPLDETAPFNPISAYAISKANTERGLAALADAQFSPVYLRNATAYGVSPRMRFDLVLNNLAAWAATTGQIRVLSDGTPWRPLVHIRDIALAALCAVEAPRAAVHNQAFNIGRSDANYRIVDIAEAVRQAVPGSSLVITGETGGDRRSYRVDFTKAETGLPGFRPRWTLAEGCAELAAWFAGRRLSEAEFQSRLYVRLKQINHLQATGAVDEALRWCQ